MVDGMEELAELIDDSTDVVETDSEGVSIELIFRSPNGKKVYLNTPVDNKPELLKHLLSKFVDQWVRDSKYLKTGGEFADLEKALVAAYELFYAEKKQETKNATIEDHTND